MSFKENLGKNPLSIRKSYKVLEENGIPNESMIPNNSFSFFIPYDLGALGRELESHCPE